MTKLEDLKVKYADAILANKYFSNQVATLEQAIVEETKAVTSAKKVEVSAIDKED